MNVRLKQLRTPKANKKSFRTIYYSTKQGGGRKTVQMGESMLETTLITLLEHNPDVIEYLNQAVPQDANGNFNPLTYTRKDGAVEE